ncbi:MAG: hypothetical protein ABII18_02565 [bacterium]|nr:hypothetical protein [bacterium]MBU1916592.1 hypothetical protein [bacterium]
MQSIILFIAVCFCLVAVAAEPVMPTKELKPVTKGPIDIDLPYKLPSIDDNGEGSSDDNGDFMGDDKKEKEVDWTKVFYIPSKYPVIGPAGDPDL